MITTEKEIIANDGLPLHSYIWMPESNIEVKAILLLVHGSVEYAQRYQSFAEYLTSNGIGVYAFDLRGHGKTTDLNSKDFAHIPYKTGWNQLMQDVAAVQKEIKNDNPGIPNFLFGHSMGSFLVRDYIATMSAEFEGLILCGTTLGHKLEVQLLLQLANVMAVFLDPKDKNKFLHNQVYNKLNKDIKNPETPVDFISTDKAEVQKYMEDELSGQTISIGYAHEMGKGLLRTSSEENINKIPKDLPILMVSGEEDPVGGKKGKDVKALYELYQKLGIKDVNLNLYEGVRHEILNDVKRDQVMQDIKDWIIEKL